MSTEQSKKQAKVSLEIRVPANIAWRGLTDARELQIWFCQHANVNLKEGENYQFSGKYIPFMRYEDKVEQKILSLDPENLSITFQWPVRNRDGDIVDSEVSYKISSIDEHVSRLDVVHTVGVDDLSDDDLRNLWALLLNGYVFHMEGASAWVRPEFTQKKGTEFQLELWIAAKRDIVFDTLTSVDGIKGFFAPQVKQVDTEKGGILDLGYDKLPIHEIEKNTRFAFGWREVADGDPNLTVAWELQDEGNGTHVSLTEGEFSDTIIFSSRADYDGWAAVMNDFKRFIETGRHPIFLSILVEPVEGE